MTFNVRAIAWGITCASSFSTSVSASPQTGGSHDELFANAALGYRQIQGWIDSGQFKRAESAASDWAKRIHAVGVTPCTAQILLGEAMLLEGRPAEAAPNLASGWGSGHAPRLHQDLLFAAAIEKPEREKYAGVAYIGLAQYYRQNEKLLRPLIGEFDWYGLPKDSVRIAGLGALFYAYLPDTQPCVGMILVAEAERDLPSLSGPVEYVRAKIEVNLHRMEEAKSDLEAAAAQGPAATLAKDALKKLALTDP